MARKGKVDTKAGDLSIYEQSIIFRNRVLFLRRKPMFNEIAVIANMINDAYEEGYERRSEEVSSALKGLIK